MQIVFAVGNGTQPPELGTVAQMAQTDPAMLQCYNHLVRALDVNGRSRANAAELIEMPFVQLPDAPN